MLKVCFLAAVVALQVWSHPFDFGLAQVNVAGDRLNTALELNPAAVAGLLGVQVTNLNALTIEARAQQLASLTLGSGALRRGGKPCIWDTARAQILPQAIRLETQAHCSSGEPRFQWSLPFVASPRLVPTFQLMIKMDANGSERVFFAERGRDTIDFEWKEDAGSWSQFVTMGIEHIGAAPSQWYGPQGFHFPEGLDHILFLLALLLGGGSLLQLLATASGFTVGHSITLALATLGIVRLPSRLVEAAIAFSIAYVAAANIVQKGSPHRWKLAAFFGLVHGFGFASAIASLNLGTQSLARALIGFNVGVEVGQMVILALLFPLLVGIKRVRWMWGYEARVGSSGIFFVGCYWFFARAFGM